MALLDGHPELVVYAQESRFFLDFVPQVDDAETVRLGEQIMLESWQLDNIYYQKFLSHVSSDEVKHRYRLRLQEMEEVATPATYLTAAILAYGEASGQLHSKTRHWVEKTPHNERYVDLIFRWWPHAKCIHMLRDPRDFWFTLLNRARKRNRKSPSMEAVAFVWRQSVRLLQQNQSRYGKERYLRVRYEDLVTEPKREIDRITSFLDISSHETLFIPTKGGGEISWKGNAVSDTYDAISADHVGRWRGRVPQAKLYLLEALLEGEMLYAGYERTMSSQSGVQVRALPYRLLLQLRTARAYIQSRRLHAKVTNE
jgi:hypothetical protein